MAQAKKKAKVEPNLPATRDHGDKPSYLQKFETKGPIQKRDNFDSSDVTIPRVKLIQALSKEIETYDSAKAGTLWHTGMDLPLGTEVDFVVVSRRKKYLLVAPLDDGQGILARADDFIHWIPSSGEFQIKIKGRKTPMIWKLAPTVQESGLDKWGTYNDADENSPPAATLFYEYLVLLPEHLDLGPVVLSLTRSQIKKAKKGLNDKIQMHESAGRPMQALVFRAKVVKDSSQQGDFYNFQFVSAGFAPEPLFNQAWELKDALRTYKTQGEDDAAREGEAPGGKTGDDPSDY